MIDSKYNLAIIRKVSKIIKFLCICLIITFISVTPVLADENSDMTLDTAIMIAKNRLEIPEDYKLTMSYLAAEDGPYWYLQFEDKKTQKGIAALINTKDGLVREYIYVDDNVNTNSSRISESKAMDVALSFIRKQLPLSDYNQPYITKKWLEQNYNRVENYQFSFRRSVNGYPFLNDSIYVTVNAFTGKISSFKLSWTSENLLFNEIPKLNFKEASEKFNNEVGFELGYVGVIDQSDSSPTREKLVLGYYPKLNGGFIDGVTGEITSTYRFLSNSKKTYHSLTIDDAKPVKSEPLNRNQAENIAKEFGNVPANYRLSSVINANSKWEFEWSSNYYEEYIFIGIEETSGEIVEFHKSVKNQDQSKMISKSEAQKLAVEFLKKACPSKLHLLKEEDINEIDEDPVYNEQELYFPQYLNELPIKNYGVNVIVNADGTINSYEARIWSGLVPNLGKVIQESEVRELFNRRFINNLSYVRETSRDKPLLAYSFGPGVFIFIDASTGEFKDYDGNLLDQELLEKYSKNWAGKDIAKLITAGVIEDTFTPTNPISRAQISKLLLLALRLNVYYPDNATFKDVDRTHQYYGYIEAVHAGGIFKGLEGSFKPEQLLTREEIAVLLTDIIKNNDQLKGKSPVIKDIKSISNSARHGVIKAIKLGLMKCNSKGLFQPKSKITQAEVAVMIVKLIELQKADCLVLKKPINKGFIHHP